MALTGARRADVIARVERCAAMRPMQQAGVAA